MMSGTVETMLKIKQPLISQPIKILIVENEMIIAANISLQLFQVYGYELQPLSKG